VIEVVPLTSRYVDDAVKVHFDAFRGYANTKLGRRYVQQFLLWFSRCKGGIALVAVDGEEVLGYVVGAPSGYGSALNRELFPLVAAQALIRPWLVVDRRFMRAAWARLKSVFGRRRSAVRQPAPAPPAATMSLVGIGTGSAHRGRGVGMLLMTDFERAAREKGMRMVRLTVYADNAAARRVYERSGWKAEPSEPGAAMAYTKRLET
jgi:ribosomal protein S18 acetylase RimI-like enzyme